jgi:hypothetical protein
MRYISTLLALSAATAILALPLNINLGAYSPALVVGDGEISFGGTESAEAIVNRLVGVSVGTDTAKTASLTQAATSTADGSTIIQPAGVAAEGVLPNVSPLPTGSGIGASTVQPRGPEVDRADSTTEEKRDALVDKRDLTGFNAALNFAAGALTTSPEVQLGTGEGGSGVGITVSPGASAGGGTKIGKREKGTTLNLLKIRSLNKTN